MLRIYRNADTDYIKKLLTEMEADKEITYKIDIKEERINGELTYIQITAGQVEQCDF